jgi:hypothetical protein
VSNNDPGSPALAGFNVAQQAAMATTFITQILNPHAFRRNRTEAD